MKKRQISIITPCFNEEENIDELCARIRSTMENSPYDYEHIFVDNASSDNTVEKIRQWSEKDNRIKAIVNTRNFGHIRSPYYGLLQATGEAVISLASDIQDPPERLLEFIQKWEEGYKVVIGVKKKSEEFGLFFFLRSLYYRILHTLSDVPLIDNFTGFGLYDRQVIDILRELNDPYPYFRGLIADLGFKRAQIDFVQPRRKRGISKNNFYTLYDMAMLGVTGYTKIPLRVAAMFGFVASLTSFLVGLIYLFYKLLFWSRFQLGSAPIVIGLFFIGSIQLFFLGIVGEYIGAIYTQVMKRPLVIEKERINF